MVASCARPGAPPGGPEDRDPPRVLHVFPESLAVDVASSSELEITFSEKVDHRTFEKALWVVPGGTAEAIGFSGTVARVRLRDSLPESTTVRVLVTTLLKDRRNLAMAEPYGWYFSTGPRLDGGGVDGKVELVGVNASQGVLFVGLFEAGGDTLPDPSRATPVALTQARKDGRFALEGLPIDGVPRLLYAMLDRDGNREIGGRGEFFSALPETLVLSDVDPRREVGLRLVDPEAPCDLSGVLARAEGDSVDVWVVAAATGADSLEASPVQVRSGKDGSFRLRRLPPAVYRLSAFCDRNANGKQDEGEGSVVVLSEVDAPPGGTIEVGEIPGPGCGGE